MRDVFFSLHGLMTHYREIKCAVSSKPAIMPKQNEADISFFNARSMKSSMEDRFAFICDIEGFIKHYHLKQKTGDGYTPIPLDCLYEIFIIRFSRETSKFRSVRDLSRYFRERISRGDPIPRRLQHHNHIASVAHAMEDDALEYYKGKGMIVTEEEFLVHIGIDPDSIPSKTI